MDLTTNIDPFYGTDGPHTARCILIGEAWGSEERAQQKPFVGEAGKELNRILADAGISRNDILCANLVDAQPPRNEFHHFTYSKDEAKRLGIPLDRGVAPKPQLLVGIAKIHKLIEAVRPQIIIAAGNWPLWALTNLELKTTSVPKKKGVPKHNAPTGITSWRGSQLRTPAGIRLVPIIHPAAILRQWPYRARTVHDLRTRVRSCIYGTPWTEPIYNFRTNQDAKDTLECLRMLYSLVPSSRISADLEWCNNFIAILGLAWSDRDAISIPFRRKGGYNHFTTIEEQEVRLALRKLFSRTDLEFVLQNATADLQFLEAEQVWPVGNYPYMDTMLAQHVCWPGTPRVLEYLSSMYCMYHRYWKDERQEWDESMDEQTEWNYNCLDCCATYEISFELEEVIDKLGFWPQFHEQMEQFAMQSEITRQGILIDVGARIQQQAFTLEQRMEHEHFLNLVMPPDIPQSIRTTGMKVPWYNSPTQQMAIFYDVFRFPERIDRKTKSRTIDDAALRQIEEAEPCMTPLTKTIRQLRSLNVYYNTFLSMPMDPDNRVRSSFDRTASFRWASRESAYGTGGNLQNLPKGEDKG